MFRNDRPFPNGNAIRALLVREHAREATIRSTLRRTINERSPDDPDESELASICVQAAHQREHDVVLLPWPLMVKILQALEPRDRRWY